MFFFVDDVALVSLSINTYVPEGEEVNLTCPMKIAMADLTWRGPPNLSIYSSGHKERELKNVKLIHVEGTSENILMISKFQTNNEGLYSCVSLRGGDESFNVTMLRKYHTHINVFLQCTYVPTTYFMRPRNGNMACFKIKILK